jgi:phosphate ABC transporter phosphate-binding protein
MVAVMSMLIVASAPAGATAYVPVYGEGSSWSANALNQWISDVQPDGMRVQYISNGSTAGRQAFIDGQTDFAASDIPFQTNPTDGSAPESPQPNSYAYMPITAGGTVFMYNLKINGQQVTDLRLSGQNLAKIFTGQITNWDSPALAADNPALKLPDQSIVPVVRSDGAGSSYELSEWMNDQYPSIWNNYCSASGRAPSCGPTSFYPTVTGSSMVAQPGDLGVAGYVSQGYADGSIGYVEYSYALNDNFPVVQMLNAAGYYTQPSAQNVAVSLLAAKVDTTDVDNPAKYLTENLTGVYADADPRTYPLSSYSYLILPTKVQGQFNKAEGTTLAAFSYFAMCQGQQQSASLGYSPMPANLVEAAFNQIATIPGADVQNINIQNCNNPTLSSDGNINLNLLAQTAPYPPACDKQGPTQCTYATGGAHTSTPVSSGKPQSNGSPGGGAAPPGGSSGDGTNAGSPGGGGASGSGGAGGTSGSGSSGTGTGGGTYNSAARAAAVRTCLSQHPKDKAYCEAKATDAASNGQSQLAGTDPSPDTQTLAVTTGWSIEQTLILLVALVIVAVILVPGGLLSRRRKRSVR